MKLRPVVLALFIAGWFLMSHWLGFPRAAVAGLVVLASSLAATALCTANAKGQWQTEMLPVAWISSLIVPASLCFGAQRTLSPDLSHAILAWLIGSAGFATGSFVNSVPLRNRWRAFGSTWIIIGAGVWLGAAYLQNDRVGFHLATLATLFVVTLCWVMYHRKPFVTTAAATLVLLLVFLPVLDWVFRPRYEFDPKSDDSRRLYSFAVAKQDPSAFAAWWNYYVDQYHEMMAELGRNTTGPHTSTLPPNSHATFFRGEIKINNNGFRGPDFEFEKGDAYRIVALGESTTFGMTIEPGQKPWPEVLEQLIRERLKPARPVQVINAGVPAITLPQNTQRLISELLPLKPDLVISYHGINGFILLDRAMPRIHGHKQPAYRQRPIKLLADAEYGIKLRLYRRSLEPKAVPFRDGSVAPDETEYAAAYRDLITVARTNGIRLALANFSMAVNDRSAPDVVAFYRAGFPSVHLQIKANELHSGLVASLAGEHPDVLFMNTHPELDGAHEKFIDLIHFTQKGREQLAENIYRSIEATLKAAIGTQAAATAPRVPAR